MELKSPGTKGAENLYPHKTLQVDVYSSLVGNCPDLEANHVGGCGNTVVHADDGMLFRDTKK